MLAKALAASRRATRWPATSCDRVGRSLTHVSKLLSDLAARGVHFQTVDDGIDTQGSTGKLILHILGAIAEFERDLILDRTRAGLAMARQRGKRLGPPIKWRPDMVKRARELMAKDGLNADDTADLLKVSRRTLFRGLKAAREQDELAKS